MQTIIYQCDRFYAFGSLMQPEDMHALIQYRKLTHPQFQRQDRKIQNYCHKPALIRSLFVLGERVAVTMELPCYTLFLCGVFNISDSACIPFLNLKRESCLVL